MPITTIILAVHLSLNPDRIQQRSGRLTKLWELNASLLGLGVSLATATIVHENVKNLAGRPRPDFLSICQPDLDNIAMHTVGGYGQGLSPLWAMVNRGICQQHQAVLNDAFRSFPSGYATISFAGLWYLSLWLSTKVDLLSPRQHRSRTDDDQGAQSEPFLDETNPFAPPAGPRAYLLFLPYVPLGLAIFIAGSRYFDFRNHGSDVLAGAVVGTISAWVGLRWYKLHSDFEKQLSPSA